MKILFYTNSFYPDSIGIAFYNAELVEHLQRLGHTVEVLTALPYYPQWRIPEAYRGRFRVEEDYRGARVTRTWVYVPERQRVLGRFLCELSFMLSSLPVLLRRRPDLVVAISPPFGVALAASVHSRLSGVPLWMHLQDLQIDAGQAVGFFRRGWMLSGLEMLERAVLAQARALSTITKAMQERVIGKGFPESRITIFPNWVDTERMRPIADTAEFRRRFGLEGRFVVLYAGNIGIHQGLDSLLDAAAVLRERPDIAFVVAGDGNYREIFARRLAQRPELHVRLLPLQPKERLAEMLSSADVGLVMETRQMANLSMPSKILNQMACGRPIVAVTAPETALARVLRETGAGLIVSPGHGESLALCLADLASAPDKCRTMGQAARAYVERDAARDQLLQRVPQILERALRPWQDLHREYRFKRALDIVLALAGFVASSPLWIIIPAGVWLGDRGPVFYRQMRVGRYGRLFPALKFRSMRVEELPENDRRQARRGDPRVTRFGGWLRKTAMDEAPQLWNILIGDMSFVGPRALLPAEIEVRAEYRGAVPVQE
ncbi:MAG TPA: WcaI family glycosyltransferase, partial [Elusimicrobiota bacterium]|nr:WcaI family glycosyltransferase [Elusimicrobiota bacterium]